MDFLYLGSSTSSGKLLSVVMSASQFSAEDREYLIKGNWLLTDWLDQYKHLENIKNILIENYYLYIYFFQRNIIYWKK